MLGLAPKTPFSACAPFLCVLLVLCRWLLWLCVEAAAVESEESEVCDLGNDRVENETALDTIVSRIQNRCVAADSVELWLRYRSLEAMLKLLLVISILGLVGGFTTVKLQTHASTRHQHYSSLARHQLTTAAHAIPSAVAPHARGETRFSKLRRWTKRHVNSSRLVKPCLFTLAAILAVLHPPHGQAREDTRNTSRARVSTSRECQRLRITINRCYR
jgi:hypothetical protein